MTTLIETLALAWLLGIAIISYEGTTSYSVDSELCAEPGGNANLPPPPEN
jgi:hypothetical protein